jgi:hypothetical protein
MDDKTLYASVPAPVEGSVLRREDFGGMLAGGNLPILNLNPDAVAIWELIDGKHTVADIEKALTEIYETDDVRRDLLEFIRFCLHTGCIVLRA